MNINLISVPIMYGCDRNGTQYTPNTLREKKIVEIIEEQGHKVYDFGNLFIPNISQTKKFADHKNIKYLNPILDMNNNLAHLVYSSLSSKSFPFIIGGDHSLGLGSISGASKFFDNLAVVWIDAHGDINTHKTSPSSNAHGMPLAAALGVGESSLVDVYYKGAKVKPENVYIIGARDLDKGEIQLAKDLNLHLYTMDNIRKIGLEVVIKKIITNIKASNIDGVHLSFDIDALDKNLVPGTGTPVSNGFNIEEVTKIFKSLLSTNLITSMDFVELNPLLDKNDTTTNLCVNLIEQIFKYIN